MYLDLDTAGKLVAESRRPFVDCVVSLLVTAMYKLTIDSLSNSALITTRGLETSIRINCL